MKPDLRSVPDADLATAYDRANELAIGRFHRACELGALDAAFDADRALEEAAATGGDGPPAWLKTLAPSSEVGGPPSKADVARDNDTIKPANQAFGEPTWREQAR